MRKYLVPLLAIGALAIPAGTALGQDDPPVDPAPPEFAPPTPPAAVTDPDSAGAFAKIYVAQHVRDFLRTDRRRIRVIDADARCLQSPILDTRFGCVFTLKALVISRRHGWDWADGSRAHSSGGKDHGRRHHNRRFRVRQIGCLGFLRIDGGPSVTPTVNVVNVECARIPRGDRDIVAPTDA